METLQSRGNGDAGRLSQELVELGPWFHNLHLPDGVQTAPDHPLGDFPAYKWEQLGPALPEDLSGWSVLDIGCNAGFYSFELARRGAHVCGIDRDPHYLRQAHWAAEKLGLDDQIEFRQMQIYELARSPRSYDLVLFLGVFYHLRYPLLALDLIAERTERMLAFQSLTFDDEAPGEQPDDLALDERSVLGDKGWPKMAFIRHHIEGDPTNWWVPNRSCIEVMLRDCGFDPVARPGPETFVCQRIDDTASVAERTAEQLGAALGRKHYVPGDARSIGPPAGGDGVRTRP
jgi:tRNA (mo5U34)-methyltransferase